MSPIIEMIVFVHNKYKSKMQSLTNLKADFLQIVAAKMNHGDLEC